MPEERNGSGYGVYFIRPLRSLVLGREKTVELYQRIIAKTDKETAKKKRPVKPVKPLERVQLRKVAGKRRIATGR